MLQLKVLKCPEIKKMQSHPLTNSQGLDWFSVSVSACQGTLDQVYLVNVQLVRNLLIRIWYWQ